MAELTDEEIERGAELLVAQAVAQGKGRTVDNPVIIDKLTSIMQDVVDTLHDRP